MCCLTMYIAQGDSKNATQCFEKVLAAKPSNYEMGFKGGCAQCISILEQGDLMVGVVNALVSWNMEI